MCHKWLSKLRKQKQVKVKKLGDIIILVVGYAELPTCTKTRKKLSSKERFYYIMKLNYFLLKQYVSSVQ